MAAPPQLRFVAIAEAYDELDGETQTQAAEYKEVV